MDVTIDRLHALVPAAEELDLLEQHRDELLRAHVHDLYVGAVRVFGDDPVDGDAPDDAGPVDPEPPTLSHEAAIAFVLDRLGGRRLR